MKNRKNTLIAPPKAVNILRPMDVERRYGITAPTRWRWEQAGVLPPRDVYRGSRPWGWYESTLAASESRPADATKGCASESAAQA